MFLFPHARTFAVRLTLVWLSLLWATLAPAQPSSFEAVLDAAREELTTLQTQTADAKDDARLMQLRESATALQARVQDGAAAIDPQIATIDARLKELGPAPENGKEAGDIGAQRRALEKARASLDAQAKLAALLLVEAEQTLGEIAARRRALFQERLTERNHSPLGRRFWAEIASEASRDKGRIAAALGTVQDAATQISLGAWALTLLAAAAILLARAALNRVLLQLLLARRSHAALRVFTFVALWTIAAALLARCAVLAFVDEGEPSQRLEVFFNSLIAATSFAAYVVALGSTFVAACDSRARWDVLPQFIAAKLRGLPLAFGAVLALTAVVEQAAALLNLSLATTVLIEGIMALLTTAVLANHLYRIAPTQVPHWPHHARSTPPSHAAALPVWVGILIAVSWIVLGVSTFCVLVGYVALGSFIVKQFSWALIVVVSGLLLASVAATLITRLLTPKDVDLSQVTATSRIASARLQAAVLFSALAQITIGFFALLLLLAPYGAGPSEFLQHAARAQEGIAIGKIQLRPAELAHAVVVLVLGLAAVRLAQRWMQERYLPLTRMDAGMRDSIASLTTYVGYVIVVALVLSALGVGLQQIAWVASALAVGIGFGLQAIVQNFVSGLILLAERPVRVGDWVSLGDIEGDVRRIHARATEIQKGDRSTVIVPNSEFITKSVRNVTYNTPLGLVQIKLPMPLGTDIERVRSELLQAFQSNDDVLKDPGPNVFLDGIDGGTVLFNATGFVRSPRTAYGVRSAVLFDALSRLRTAGLEMVKPMTVVMEQPRA